VCRRHLNGVGALSLVDVVEKGHEGLLQLLKVSQSPGIDDNVLGAAARGSQGEGPSLGPNRQEGRGHGCCENKKIETSPSAEEHLCFLSSEEGLTDDGR